MVKKKWFLDICVYLVWFPIVALLFWIALQLHTAVENGLIAFYVRDQPLLIRTADVIVKYSFAFMICIWIVAIILIEAYLRNGLKKKSLVKRFSRIFGPGLILLFLIDLFNILMMELNTAGWLRWVVIAAELLVGGVITYYGFFRLGHKVETGPLRP